jgi:hypothetical protein
LFAAVAGCAVEGADDVDTEDTTTTATVDAWQPIASLELDTGLTIEFYEPKPGALMVMQSAAVGVPPLRGDYRALDIYRAFAPDSPVPDVLLAAQARADALGGKGAGDDPDAAKRAIAGIVDDYGAASAEMAVGYINNQSCDDEWFHDHFCNVVYMEDWEACKLDHWDGYASWSSSVDRAYYAACADIGNVSLRITMGDGSGGDWTLLEGHYREYNWQTPWINESTRGEIYNATNNRFHYTAQYIF